MQIIPGSRHGNRKRRKMDFRDNAREEEWKKVSPRSVNIQQVMGNSFGEKVNFSHVSCKIFL